jgi:translation initiation factor 4E
MDKEKDKVEGNAQAELPVSQVIKHPLQNSWTLWFYENDRNKSWEDNQVEIYTFNTVEDFWS